MILTLKIYTDDTLVDVKRIVEADRLKIPYRVAITVAQSLDGLDIDSENDIINLISQNIDKVDKIIKATFGVTDSELECVDAGELVSVASEIYRWAIGKFNDVKGDNSKN